MCLLSTVVLVSIVSKMPIVMLIGWRETTMVAIHLELMSHNQGLLVAGNHNLLWMFVCDAKKRFGDE